MSKAWAITIISAVAAMEVVLTLTHHLGHVMFFGFAVWAITYVLSIELKDKR